MNFNQPESATATIDPPVTLDTSPSSSNRHSTTSPSQVLAIVCVGITLANLDLFSINVALPRIAEDFHGVSLENLSWILNGYAIAYASLLVFFGRLSEGFRRDRSYILGIGIFTVAAAACATATNVWELVLFRVIAAAGAALMTPTSLGLLLASFPPEKRGNAVRNWAAIGGFAAALGPLVGGLLAAIDWRWIFIVNTIIGVISIVIAWKKLPYVAGHAVKKPSITAALLITCGICCLIFSIIKANSWGLHSPKIITSFVISIVLLTLFVVHSLISSNPLIDPKLFHIRSFSGAALALFPYSITFGAMLFSISVWGQTVWHWSVLQAGIEIIPGPFLVPIISLLFTEKLIRKFGTAFVVSVGIIAIILGFCLWGTLMTLTPNNMLVFFGMILNGIGVGLVFPTLMGVSSHALPSHSFATGSGMINMFRQAAIAIGVALFVAIIGVPSSAQDRLEAFHQGWILMAVITAFTLIPTYFIIRKSDK